MSGIINLISLKCSKHHRLILFFLFPLISSCNSKPPEVSEIILPPRLPNEFSSVPASVEKPNLISLLSSEEKIKDIRVGRDDPFLPPQANGEELFIPFSFKYYGQISSGKTLNAFVSYKDKSGFLKEGDIGGLTTDLLPKDWMIVHLDTDTKVLKLGFGNRFIDVELFPKVSR